MPFDLVKLDDVESKVAIITDRNESLTYQELWDSINGMTNQIEAGRLALIIMNNDLGAVIYYLSCIKIGVVPIILDKNVGKEVLEYYVAKYEPEYILGLSKEKEVQAYIKTAGYIKKTDIFRYSLFEKKWDKSKRIHRNLAMLLPTSGTTSDSKLVRISKTNLYNNTMNICKALKIKDSDVAITSLPLSYTYGLSILNTHLFMHATVLLTDKSVLQKSFWDFTEKYKATSFAGVPYTYELLEKKGYLMKDSSIQLYTQAGGKLSAHLQEKFTRHCSESKKKFIVMYGQTEATARMSYLPMEFGLQKIGSAGITIPEGRIAIQKNQETDDEGEIIYYGENVSMGYCNCLEDLALGNINNNVLHTGDMGYLDNDGFLYITGRKSDFVKMYGRRFGLTSISQMIQEVCGLHAYCTFEQNQIVIMYERDAKESIEEVKKWLPKRLHLSSGDFIYNMVNQFERTPNGKIRVRGCTDE